MEWYERLGKISEGCYKNRSGIIYKVAKIDNDNFEAVRLAKIGSIYVNGMRIIIVNKNGGFGNYPNPFDLIEKITIDASLYYEN